MGHQPESQGSRLRFCRLSVFAGMRRIARTMPAWSLSPRQRTAWIVATLVLLAACARVTENSEVFRLLKQLAEAGGVGSYLLYDREQDEVLRAESAQIEVERLVADEFILDVGRLEELRYIQCGNYLLPLGEDNTILRRPGTMFAPGEYRVWMTVDSDCSVAKILGHRLEPTRL